MKQGPLILGITWKVETVRVPFHPVSGKLQAQTLDVSQGHTQVVSQQNDQVAASDKKVSKKAKATAPA